MNGRDEMLNEAIAKAKEAEDWQLVEWLRAARGAESSARWYTEKLRDAHRAERKLMNENEKLRELVLHMHTCLEHYEPGDTISCKQCPYDNETWGCDYERLMAELGIEVDA